MHRSTKWLIGLIALQALILIPLVLGREYHLFLPYHWLRLLHIAGAVLFLGNIIVTGLWMASAERTGATAVLKFGVHAVNWMDVFFTAPGVILILVSGLPLASQGGGITRVPWILAALLLFVLSGVIWVGLLIPDQHRMIRLSDPVPPERALPPAFFRCLHRWYVWGVVATVLPLISLFLMVFKPKLW
ncbi:MAG TPA: DUF2269 family protein [Gemmatimonadales bacterium]|nr:DUF2269 family protein [Gemmatimonadales bacterium]